MRPFARLRPLRRLAIAGFALVLGLNFLLATPAGAHLATRAGAPVGLACHSSSAPDMAGLSVRPTSSGVSPGGFEWSNLTAQLSASPSPRIASAMAWDPVDGYVLLYGGTNSHGAVYGDSWSFANGTWTNLTASVTGAPPSLAIPQLAYDPSDREMLLFGGLTLGGNASTQTWAYHARTWTNLTGHTGATPPAEEFSAMSTDSVDSEVVLFGGSSPGTGVWGADSWTFKAGTWTNVTATASPPAGHLVYPESTDDPAIGGVLLRALFPSGTQIGSATLTFSNGAWRNVSSLVTGDTGQIFLGGGGYLAPIGVAAFVSSVVFNRSGSTIPGVNSVEFSNDTWTNVTSEVAGPPHLEELGSLSDLPNDQGLLAFGGLNAATAALAGDTWVLTSAPQVQARVAHVAIDAGTADAFSSQVTGGLAPFTYHWGFGDSASSTLASPSHTFAHAGLYQANLTVLDEIGHSVTASVWIQVEPILAASAQASPATAGTPVALIGSWSGGLPPYTFSWTLGDANSSTAASVSHIYAKAGNFSAMFTVTDALGASASQPITVSVRAAPSTSASSSGSSSVSLTSGTGLYLLLGIVLLAVIAAVLAVLLARRPRSPPSRPPPPPAVGLAPP